MAEIVDFGLQQHKIKMDNSYFDNGFSVVAGDTGRRVEVQLLDTNSMVQNTTGLNLRLNAKVAGKSTFTDATLVDAESGLYRLDLSNGMFLVPGNWEFQWQITDSTGKKLHGFSFRGNVGSNISEGGAEATNFYFNLKELQELVKDVNNIPPERTSFLEIGGFSKVTTDLYKSITLSPQGDFYMTENGQMANTAATQPYKNTGKVTIIAGAEYKTKGVNTWLFYDANNVYLGYWQYTESGAIDATSLQDLPIRANASYMIGNVNNLYWKVSPVTTPEILQITDTADAISFPKLVVEPSNLGDEVKEMIGGAGIAKQYRNETIVNFGDSIIENKNPSVSDFLAEYTGATTINVGFGGCMMSPHPNADFAKFSMSNLVDSIVSKNFSAQEASLSASGIPSGFRATLTALKAIDFLKVKTISISYGTNDWLNSNKIDNPLDKYDKAYYLGALRYSVRKMQQNYPNLEVVISAPIFRSTNDRTENANNWKNGNTEYLKDYANAVTNVAKELKILAADTFYGLGINEFNEGHFFPTTDGTHPNAKGRALLASKLAETIVYGASANPNVSDLDDRLNKMDVEIATLDEDVVVSATNMTSLKNYNAGTNYSISTQSDEIIALVTGLGITSRFADTVKKTFEENHLYYVRFELLPKYNTTTLISMRGMGTSSPFKIVPNVWNTLSAISLPTSVGSGEFFIYHYTDKNYAIGDTVKFRKPIIIDLTATFGAGKEPTQSQMDRLLTQFPNSWFDGTENLFLAKWALDELRRLDTEKVNKKQEGWVTPVTLNGWSSGSLEYMKDNFGFVHIRGGTSSGTLNTAAFILPIGYRPKGAYYYSTESFSTSTGIVYIESNGTVLIRAGNVSRVSINIPTFEAVN